MNWAPPIRCTHGRIQKWNRRKEGYSEPILLPEGQWRCVALVVSELEVLVFNVQRVW